MERFQTNISMPEKDKKSESPKTSDTKEGVDGLNADVKAAKEAALKDARSTVTKAGKVMDIVEQGELTESRRSALEVLKEKLTGLQARIDRTEGVADEIEKTLGRINKKVEQEEALKTDIALTEAQKYMTNPAAWNEFIGYAKGVLRRQEYLGNDAASHADDAKLTALNTERLAAIDAYSKSMPKAPTNWQPDRENQVRMLGALQALATLEDVTEQYEKYRGIVDGVRKLGDRVFVVPMDTTVTLDVRRNNSQAPNMITLNSAPGTDHTSGTSDLNIKRTEGGWEVTMKPDFTGKLLVNRGTTKEGWNTFDVGQAATAPNAQPEAKKQPSTQAPKTEKAPPAVAQEKKSSGLRTRGFGSAPEPEDEPKKKEVVQNPGAAKTNTAEKQKDIIPTSGEITLPTNQTVFVRPKNSQIYNYLRPDYVGHWTLGNFAEADRSADGSRWIIKPMQGAGALETSLDGRTWTDAGTTEKTVPKTAPATAPAPKPTTPKKAPSAAQEPAKEAPKKADPAAEKREGVPSTELVQTSAMTLEFPATDTVSISYVTPKARSIKPWELRTKVSKLDFYLYSITKEKGVWKFAMKPGQTGNITVSLASGVMKTFSLGENIPFDAKKNTEQQQAPLPKTDAPKSNDKTVDPQAKKLAGASTAEPENVPAPQAKKTTQPKEMNPKDTTVPKRKAKLPSSEKTASDTRSVSPDRGIRSRSFGSGSPEATPTQPTRPKGKRIIAQSKGGGTDSYIYENTTARYEELDLLSVEDLRSQAKKLGILSDQDKDQLIMDLIKFEEKTPAKKEVVLSAERVDTLFNSYNTLYKEYTETMQKDSATYGGNKEWRLFDQEWAQLMFDVEEQFGGNTPRFVDLKGWRELLRTAKGKIAIAETLPKMRKLLDDYKATKFEKSAPTPVQKINTLAGNTEVLKQSIAKYRTIIAAKGGTITKDFAKLDTLYTDALKLEEKPAMQKAILVCHEALAKNYAETKGTASVNLFGSAMNMVSDVTSFRPGMTEADVRAKLLERSERTPVELNLTPSQLVQLVHIKQKVDVLRTRTDLTEAQRYDELVGIIGDNSEVLESISKKSREQLQSLKTLGYSAEVAMKDTFNPETIDWLQAAHLSATPVMGISDRAFFYVKPVKKTVKPPTPSVAKQPEMRAKGISASASAIPDLTLEKDDTEKYGGRLLTPKEVQDLGLVILKGEKAKVLDGDTYIACTKNNCRPIKSKAQMEEAAQEKKEAAKTTANTPPVQPAETVTKAPEKNNGISANGREFRIGINESFTINFNPPMGGSSSVSFTPSSYDLKGIVVNAKKYSDVWVIDVVPQYEGTITLTRARDKASASLAVKADPAVLAAIEKAKELTVREISSEEEFNELVLKSPVPVVVDLYATWCQPCKDMQPDLEAIAREQGGTVRVVKVDGEKFSKIQSEYAPKQDGQYKFPTLLIFEKGKKLRGAIGRRTRDKIQELLPPLERSNVTMR